MYTTKPKSATLKRAGRKKRAKEESQGKIDPGNIQTRNTDKLLAKTKATTIDKTNGITQIDDVHFDAREIASWMVE